MGKRSRVRSFSSICLAFIVIAGSVASWATNSARAQNSGGVTTLTGTMSLDMAIDPTQYMGLVDMTGFVRRDYNYLQGDSLITGAINHETGTFQIDLPTKPSAPLNDVGHGTDATSGVQIYSIDPFWNLIGDERLSPWEFSGWSWYGTSIKTAHGTHEVTGGTIAVWAPDDAQQFPTDLGTDGKLFTDDDPVATIGAGWTVVDMDQHPFVQKRETSVDVPVGLNEGTPDDLSALTATAAFDQMVEILRARYPFAKEIPIDWDAISATYRPEFEAAEQSGEQVDFWLALNHFLIALHHWAYFAVYPWVDSFVGQLLGSTGLHVEVTDDDKVIVDKVDSDQAAERAGIQAGVELVTWNGMPARQALDASLQLFTESSPQTALRNQMSFFGRMPPGTTVRVEYRNPGTTDLSTVELTAVEIPNEDIERSARCVQSWARCEPLDPPVWLERLPSNIAVLHVHFFATDAQSHRSIIDAWEQALRNLSFSDVTGLIIDFRGGGAALDGGTMPVYMAGSFFDEPFKLADVTSVDADGNDVTVGSYSVLPTPVRWDRPVALIVDEWCKSTCELFTLALTHRPNTIIAGMTPTGGSLSGVMESILLPTGNFVTVIDQAYRDPSTHELLVEGKGIEPTLRIPKIAETLVENVSTDVVRNAAEQALLEQIANPPQATPDAAS